MIKANMNESKHAYLIMAHKAEYVLTTLIKMLDSVHNDIYIHFDLKSKDNTYLHLKGCVKYSRLTFVKRIKVYWGHISQCKAMYLLWEAAYNQGPYDYYHLISGVDLPIQTQSQIMNFFEANRGKNFVGFSENKIPDKYNLHYFHPRYKRIGLAQHLLHLLEKKLGIRNRLFDKYILQRGCNWSSLTNDAVGILIARKNEFLQALKYTNCPDECITQTILYNSKLKDTIFNMNNEQRSCMRLIDWQRGTPYNYTVKDLEEIISSDLIFCRKISENALADKIYKTYADNI